MRNLRLIICLAIGCFVGAGSLRAQQLPVPGQSDQQWIVREIPPLYQGKILQKDVQPGVDAMPMQKYKPVPIDPRTGNLISHYNAQTGLHYDMEHGLITDTRTGRLYQFYRKGEQPKPMPQPSRGSLL